MMLAQEIQWPATIQTLIGVVGLLSIVSLVFAVVLQGKKLFGRTPPMDAELDKRDKALRKMIFASEANLKERINSLEERYEEMQLDRERKWSSLQLQYHDLDKKLAVVIEWIDDKRKRNA